MSKLNSTEAPATEETNSNGGLSVRLVLHAVRRHPLSFLGVIFLTASSLAGVWHYIPLPNKSAAVVFQVSSQPEVLLSQTLENRTDFTAYKQSQLALLKSRRTLSAVSKDPEIQDLQMVQKARPDVIGWLDSSLTVDSRDGRVEFVRVTIDGEHEEELLTLLSAVAKAYLAAAHERDNGARFRRQADLVKTYESARNELKQFLDKIDQIAVKLGSKDAATLAFFDAFRQDSLRVAIHDHAVTRDELELAATYLAVAKNSRNSAVLAVTGAVGAIRLPQGGSNAIVPQAAIEEEIRRDSVYRGLEESVLKLRQTLKETELLFQPGTNPPAVARARTELKTAEEKRDKYYLEARSQAEAILKERLVQNEEGRIALLQADYDRIKVRLDRAAAKVTELQQEIGKTNIYRLELENIRSNIAQKERMTARIADELEQLKIEKVPQRVSLAEEPVLVAGIAGNRRLKYALFTGLAVFLLGFGGIVGKEYLNRRVTQADEVSTALGTRLIGTIPPFATNARGGSTTHDHAVLVEAIDTTRTMLMHGSPDGAGRRVLLVTSALSGEGKTTLAGHLAISLTRAGFRTLLVDGDMHAPSAHTLFDIPRSPGLSELLCGEVELARAVRSSSIPGLSLLPAGNWTMATRQMLVGNRWGLLKREMERRFDFVLIDTSPLLQVTDTILLAKEVDGVILSVMMGVSQVARVAESVTRLHAVGAVLSGVIVNNVRSPFHDYKFAYPSKYPSPLVLPGAGPVVEAAGETRARADVTGTSGVEAPLLFAEEWSDD